MVERGGWVGENAGARVCVCVRARAHAEVCVT
jgi:hypothetical protein